MKELVEVIAKALVDCPDEVSVSEKQEGRTTVLELHVAESDMGKVIGKQGRIAKAIRSVVKAAAAKAYFNCHTDITIPYDELDKITVIRKDGTALFFSAETVVKLKKQGESRKGTDAGLSRAD